MNTDDCYSHISDGLIYVDSSFPGIGIDESLYEIVPKGCECTICDENCPCVLRSGGLYEGNKLILENGPVYECNMDCHCDKSCRNRLVQNGPSIGLAVEPVDGKGFGLFSRIDLTKGSFVCEYAGEMIGVDEAKKRFGGQGNHNYILIMNEHFGGREDVTVIDPTVIGNIGRYINHSCDPNLTVVPVRINSIVPVAGIFVLKDVHAGDELCYSYQNVTADDGSSAGAAHLSTTACLCSSKLCKGFLPSNKLFTL